MGKKLMAKEVGMAVLDRVERLVKLKSTRFSYYPFDFEWKGVKAKIDVRIITLEPKKK